MRYTVKASERNLGQWLVWDSIEQSAIALCRESKDALLIASALNERG